MLGASDLTRDERFTEQKRVDDGGGNPMALGMPKWRVVTIAAISLLILGYVASCIQRTLAGEVSLLVDPVAEITYVNQTDQLIQFYNELDSRRMFPHRLVEPHSEYRFNYPLSISSTLRIVAERSDGRRVFDQSFAGREVYAIEGGRIVISSLEPID